MPPREADSAPEWAVFDGPFSLEQRQGFADTAVVGGLAQFVRRQCSALGGAAGDNGIHAACSDLTELFADYGALDPSERAQRIARAREILADMGAPQSQRPEPRPAVPRRSSTRRPERRPTRTVDDPVTVLWGVSEARARQLAGLGIYTVLDLLQHYPLRHEDRCEMVRLADLGEGDSATIKAIVDAAGETHRRGRFRLTTVPVRDEYGGVAELKWYGQDFRATQFDPETVVFATGTVRYFREMPQLDNPEVESAGNRDCLSAGRIVPLYGLTKGLYMPQMRRFAHTALRDYAHVAPEIIPEDIRSRRGLCASQFAIENIHFPRDEEALEEARHRITYEELFILQVQLARLRREAKAPETGITLQVKPEWLDDLRDALPFDLTNAQRRVIDDIAGDLTSPQPANRLLHGDVGSGKTAVAAWVVLAAARNGYQAAYMVPTEVLAEQQYRTLRDLLGPLNVEVALLVGGTRRKRELHERIAGGDVAVVVGTHAIIQESVEFDKLGLAIIDEQHRFGVRQRAALREKGYNPNIVVMTATPIPRTLALTVYGDFDISVLDELPPGRTLPSTRVLTMRQRTEAYDFVRQEIIAGRQAFVVCPLVEESESLDVQAASDLAQRMEREIFPDLRIGLVHGRMRTEEKDAVMHAFGRGHLDVLCATTVIEVGVNIPNASVMLVENAERFGLAQLHQLRGRVCRGEHESHCLLLVGARSRASRERVEVLARTNDGFEIAEEDLKVRGPGEFYGTRQHGLPDLKMASVLADTATLVEAREDALALIDTDPGLREPGHRALGERIKRRVDDRLRFVNVS